MSCDAIVLLKDDHKEILKAFKGLGRKALQQIGAGLETAREQAPRRPSQPSALKKTIDAVIA